MAERAATPKAVKACTFETEINKCRDTPSGVDRGGAWVFPAMPANTSREELD